MLTGEFDPGVLDWIVMIAQLVLDQIETSLNDLTAQIDRAYSIAWNWLTSRLPGWIQ